MNVYFLFLESIGTPELVLILFVALIVFGPRKLPQIGRTIGKYTAEFKRASTEFRQTWEREVQMAEFEEKSTDQPQQRSETGQENPVFDPVANTIGRSSARRAPNLENNFETTNEAIVVAAPEIRAASQANFTLESNISENVSEPSEQSSLAKNGKREWL